MNNASPNPIGFTVDPATGTPNPGTSTGVDITRMLLNELGVDLMWDPMAVYNSPSNATSTGTTFQTLAVTQTTDTPPIFKSQDFLTLSFQKQISQGTQTFPPSPPIQLFTSGEKQNFPFQPLGYPSNVVNMYFVNKLVPPTQQAGGTLYGFSWICNNGVSISANTFGYPKSRTSLPPRPDTITHEIGHNPCLDHTTYAAGPWTAPPYSTPGGVAPPIPAKPLVSECDPSYPACARQPDDNGEPPHRTDSRVRVCPKRHVAIGVLYHRCGCQSPIANARKRKCRSGDPPSRSALSEGRPSDAVADVAAGTGAGPAGAGCSFQLTLRYSVSGLINPIPYETTKAQLGTGGSSTDPIIFDLSGPTGGKPGETLVAWVLTLPPGKTFARHDRFHIVSQSRERPRRRGKLLPGRRQ